MKARRPLLAALPLLAVAALGFAALRRAPAPAPTPGPSPADMAAAPRAPAAPQYAAERARAVERRVYAVTLTQRVVVDGKVFAKTRLEGRLSLVPVAGTSLVEAQLTEPTLQMSGQEPPTAQDLARPMLLAHDKQGRLEGVRFDPETGEPARLVLTTIAASAQYSRGAGERWSIEERDGVGSYRADYERRAGGSVRRHKSGYLRQLDGLTPVTAEGDASLTLDDDGGIVALDARESSRAKGPTALGEVTGELSLTMRLLDRAAAGPLELASARERAALYEAPQMAMPRRDGGARQQRLDEQRVGIQNLDDLRRAFADTEGQPKGGEVGQRRAGLITTAGALLRLQPEEALAAGKQLARADVTGAEANFLAGALASAGTPEAAHALADALSSPKATLEARRHAAVSLALTPVADEHTIEALKGGADSDDPMLRSMSTVALGAEARTLAAGGGSKLDPVADLLDRYARAGDDATRNTLLAALGNSGDARAFEPIRAALGSPSLALSAAYALRFLPGAPADEALRSVATTAKAPALRREAYRAASYRSAELWAPWLEQALRTETDPQVLAAIQAAISRGAS